MLRLNLNTVNGLCGVCRHALPPRKKKGPAARFCGNTCTQKHHRSTPVYQAAKKTARIASAAVRDAARDAYYRSENRYKSADFDGKLSGPAYGFTPKLPSHHTPFVPPPCGDLFIPPAKDARKINGRTADDKRLRHAPARPQQQNRLSKIERENLKQEVARRAAETENFLRSIEVKK